MRVTTSIVAYHTSDIELEAALRSLVGMDRVYVVDNSRSASTEALCREHGAEYIPSDNVGYGAGHNKAIRRAIDHGADLHLVLNSDVAVTPEALREAVEIMSADPTIGLLHPRLRYPDGREQYTVRLVPSPFDLIARRFLPKGLFRRHLSRYELREKDRTVGRDAAYVQGSFMLLRVDTLREVGLFDERFFMYPEDIDLSRRIAADGRWTVRYEPRVEAVHGYRAESRRSLRLLMVHIVNIIRYFNKWGWVSDPSRQTLNRHILAGP